jgi:hypothetical protein
VHPIARIHGIAVDAIISKRYSVPILGKYLVIIANPAEHPAYTPFPVSLPHPYSIITDLIGGHFSA